MTMLDVLLKITDTPVRQDAQGRFALNDLHRASGGKARHRPNYWLSSEQAIELMEELEREVLTAGIPAVKNPGDELALERLTTRFRVVKPVYTAEGRYGGTFVVKELVYAYAMWISPAFHLQVIRVYDALVNAEIAHLTALASAIAPLVEVQELQAFSRRIPPGMRLKMLNQAQAVLQRMHSEWTWHARAQCYREFAYINSTLGIDTDPMEELVGPKPASVALAAMAISRESI